MKEITGMRRLDNMLTTLAKKIILNTLLSVHLENYFAKKKVLRKICKLYRFMQTFVSSEPIYFRRYEK